MTLLIPPNVMKWTEKVKNTESFAKIWCVLTWHSRGALFLFLRHPWGNIIRQDQPLLGQLWGKPSCIYQSIAANLIKWCTKFFLKIEGQKKTISHINVIFCSFYFHFVSIFKKLIMRLLSLDCLKHVQKL